VDPEELILLAAEGVAGSVFPRSPEGFAKLNETVKGKWFEAAVKVGKALDEMVEGERGVREWIAAQKGDRNFGGISDDLEEQLSWLFRENFAWRAGYENFIDYPRRFRAIRSRLGRVSSLPLVKDLEKMDLLRGYWVQWFDSWRAAPDQPGLWETGWLLEEWRISLFAPDIEVKGKVSEKRVEKAMGL